MDFYQLQKINIRKTFFLISIVIIFAGVLGFYIDYFFLGFSSATSFPLATIIAVAIASFQSIFSYYRGDKIVLAATRARPADPKNLEEKQLLNIVAEMKIAAGIPMPKVYIIESEIPNAFATGRNSEHSSIATTSSLLGLLNREELQGVIGHEMSHIKNRDILTMTVVATLLGIIVILSDFAWRWGRFYGRGKRSRRVSRGGGTLFIFILGLFLAILGPLIARVMFLAVSRSREYLADATAAEITRNPLGLASALEKLAKGQVGKPIGNKGVSHMCIVSPLKSALADKENFWANLWSTHPPIQKRIAILKNMAHAA